MSFKIHTRRRRALMAACATAAVGAAVMAPLATAGASNVAQPGARTATPIKHLVVIFQENVSFDHYFATYPNAANTDGTPFTAKPGTPSVNGLSGALLTSNPNLANPQRLGGTAQQITCDQDHEYTDEQKAFDAGKMDKFVQYTNVPSCSAPTFGSPGLVMDYYDGNSVTGLWNYAQRFAMSDNSYGTTFGPSTVGALNLVSGQTYGVAKEYSPSGSMPAGEVLDHAGNTGLGTVIGDPQPYYDDCSSRDRVALTDKNQNIGDLLNARGVTWGFFEGGFRPTSVVNGKAVCGAKHNVGAGLGATGQYGTKADYIPHHEPFQYYASTANPHHVAPSSVAMIGKTDRANHQYDLSDFWASVHNGTMPAVSYLKAAGYQDGHAGYSDPIDEQNFLVDTINKLQASPDWSSTAVVIAYDDSDGWYDHQAPVTVNGSTSAADALNGAGICGSPDQIMAGEQGRCGYGPRLPLLVISPYAKQNYVDSTLTDQSSVLSFIESNWHTGRIGGGSFDKLAGTLNNMFDFSAPNDTPLMLNPATGAVQ
ncbi:MAG: alkaline phosphatase family protein [Marmoricola sp.]